MSGRNGNKKHGRSKLCCARYRDEHRADKSKASRLLKHLRSAPWDDCARAAYERLPLIARKWTLPADTHSPSEIRRRNGVTLAALNRA